MKGVWKRKREFFIKVFYEWLSSPLILKNKVFCLAGLAVVIFLIGSYSGIRYHAYDFFMLSMCLFLAMLYKLYGTLRIIVRREYYVIEGIVCHAQSRLRAGRFYYVTLLLNHGITVVLLIDKHWHVEKGRQYKFYFRSTNLVGFQKFGAFLDTDSFLGAVEANAE